MLFVPDKELKSLHLPTFFILGIKMFLICTFILNFQHFFSNDHFEAQGKPYIIYMTAGKILHKELLYRLDIRVTC